MKVIGQKDKNPEFTTELRRIRYSLYMTQSEFCRRSNIPLGTYKAWECGTQFPAPGNWKIYIDFVAGLRGAEPLEKIKSIYISCKGV